MITKDDIIADYMAFVTSSDIGQPDISEYLDQSKIDEQTFDAFFESIEDLEMTIWEVLMRQSIETVQADPIFNEFSAKEKILSLYYTFFENASLNQEYLKKNIRMTKNIRSRLKLFDKLKPTYQAFVRNVLAQSSRYQPLLNISVFEKFTQSSRDNGSWGLFLFLLDFWQKDESNEFEKTDAAIEKAVTLATSLIDRSPFDHALDFGKFLWKERSMYTFNRFR